MMNGQESGLPMIAGRFFVVPWEFGTGHARSGTDVLSSKLLISIAAGGAIGAVGRYVVATYVAQATAGEFPYGTLTVNIVGSLIMGALVALLGVAWSPGPEVRAFLTTGVLGAFTTFSLFSLDLAAMIERGDMLSAGAYATASVLLCLGGFFLGNHLIRALV